MERKKLLLGCVARQQELNRAYKNDDGWGGEGGGVKFTVRCQCHRETRFVRGLLRRGWGNAYKEEEFVDNMSSRKMRFLCELNFCRTK